MGESRLRWIRREGIDRSPCGFCGRPSWRFSLTPGEYFFWHWCDEAEEYHRKEREHV